MTLLLLLLLGDTISSVGTHGHLILIEEWILHDTHGIHIVHRTHSCHIWDTGHVEIHAEVHGTLVGILGATSKGKLLVRVCHSGIR